MKLTHLAFGLMLLTACGQVESTSDSNTDIASDTNVAELVGTQLENKSLTFLWRDAKYDPVLKDTFDAIFINEESLKTMADAEKAALGYVATFIGSECEWDGEANEDRSNLDCKVITALGLGYQCSKEHLEFLQKWFVEDEQILSELQESNCPTVPNTATSQTTFDGIQLTTKQDTIIVAYKASGINLREQSSWEWSASDHFVLIDSHLKLIKRDKSEVTQESFGG